MKTLVLDVEMMTQQHKKMAKITCLVQFLLIVCRVETMIKRQCILLLRLLFNTYQGWAALIISGSDKFLFSREDVSQGNPLSMFMYAIDTVLLV